MSEHALELLGRMGCYEYLLILSPHADLYERIIKIKEKFAADYNRPLTTQGKAHVTLVKFITSNRMEEKISNRLHRISRGITPFKVELKDYGAFPTNSIFIPVATKLPVQNLMRAIKQVQSFMRVSKEFRPLFIEEPNITIARNLKPWQFESGWLQYAHLHFAGRFIADNMLWLKRPLAGGNYQILERFEFQSLPLTASQGNLFM